MVGDTGNIGVIHRNRIEICSSTVSGHHGRTEEVLDIGATLAGSSDENLVLVSGMSARPLTALGHVSLGKTTPLHFQEDLFIMNR
jgi:hypothetical protein